MAVLQQAAEQKDSTELCFRYALALYQRGQVRRALQVLDRVKQQDDDASIILRIVLTAEDSEEGPSKAHDALMEMAARRRRETGQPIAHWTAPAALLLLGHRKEAAEAARGNLGLNPRTHIEDFLANTYSEKQYLSEGGNSRYLVCGHWYWAGMVRLSEGDRKGAREAFKASVDTGLWSVFYHLQSQIMLARLDSDPAWPRWIKTKNDAKAPAKALPPELVKSIREGDLNAVTNQLDAGVDVNARDADGNTPLLLAASHAGADCVELLLKKGADVNAANTFGATALVRAATDFEKAKLLIDAGANVQVKTEQGKLPLTIAARRYGNSKTVQLFLDHGANATERNKQGISPVLVAAACGDLDTVKLLVAHGADVNDFPEGDGGREHDSAAGSRTPLMWAAFRNDLPMLRYLLEHKADPNKSTRYGTPLTQAAWHHNVEAAELLLANDAQVDCKDRLAGFTPLHWAAGTESPRADLVELLLKHGADPNAQGGERVDAYLSEPQTPLMIARKRGQTAIVGALTAAGATAPTKASAAPWPVKKNPEQPDIPQVRLAAERAVALLQESAIKSSEVFPRHAVINRSCVTCHQHFLPMAAVGHAKEHAIRVDRDAAKKQIDGVLGARFVGVAKDIAEVDFALDVATGRGYAAFGLLAEHVPSGPLTDLFVHHLTVIQAADGRWHMYIPRPPMVAGDVSTTALAIQVIKRYGWTGRKAEFDRAVDRGRQWLWTVKAETTEDAAYQLLGLHWAGESSDKLADLAAALMSQRRKDGGWAQLPNLDSDAYATGQALYALARAAKHPVANRDWQQGLRFLLATQCDDGSWHVIRRAFPLQPTMDSGFPHGRDSWISAAGTSWAVLAMAEALPLGTTTEKPVSAAKSPIDAPPVATEKVDFARQIKPLLERSCVACHGPDKQRSNFRVDIREALLKGGNSGSDAIVPGKSAQSPLLKYASGRVKDMEMPPISKRDKHPAFNEEEVELMRAWIEQGAMWPADAALRPHRTKD
jgi:N-acyl-D-amino-acid deacylase